MALAKNEKEITLTDGEVRLQGLLAVPPEARTWVLFAHGSGSGRRSPRNHWVARELNRQGFATLLLDLLTEEEALDRSKVFDIPLLAQRLLVAKKWVTERKPEAAGIAYFGASTGAGAALRAAALSPEGVVAVVSRGGRPDLARETLSRVEAPTLLIVGGRDEGILQFNRESFARLKCAKGFRVIPGASHLFEEPGALEEVARLTGDWIRSHAEITGKSWRTEQDSPPNP